MANSLRTASVSNIPKHWVTSSLSDVAKLVSAPNKIPKKLFLKSGQYPIISQEQEYISGYWNNKIDVIKITTPVIIFGDHTKNIKYVDFDFVYGADGIQILQSLLHIDSKFFYYLICSTYLRDLGYARHFKLLKKSKFPIPPLEEQKEIVLILDKAFEKLDHALEACEKALKLSKELWLSALDQALSPREEWTVKTLGEVCKIEKITNTNQLLPFIGLENIEANTGTLLGKEDGIKIKSNTFYFNKSHILYGRLRAYLNKTIVPDFEGQCSTEIFPLKPNENLNRKFLFYWLLNPQNAKQIDKTSTGTRMPRANMNQVMEFEFYFPPLEEQKEIVVKLDRISNRIQKLQEDYKNKISYIKELKASLLNDAFIGKLTKEK